MNSIFTGVSGMQANQQAIDVIANNVANMNTVGFKTGRVTFEEALVRTLSGASANGTNPMQIGMGGSTSTIDVLMTQGVTRPTGRPLDLAVVGSGFFVVQDGDTVKYTRDGVVQMDAENRLVMASNGMKLAGWQANLATGQLSTSGVPGEISIPLGSQYAVQTSKVTFGGNLDASVAVGTTVNSQFTIYDSLGTTHNMQIAFTKTAAGAWSWRVTSPDAAAATTPGTGTLTFDANGRLNAMTGSVSLQLANANGAVNPVAFNLDFTTANQLDGSSSMQAITQDGLPVGTLNNFSIDQDGLIFGSFSNGASRLLGQIALATFTNPAGLTREGGNLWTPSANSGEPIISTPGESSGKIRSGFLEMSNVDLASELANMIVTQRGFQANSRSITTSDEMLQEVLQLKR